MMKKEGHNSKSQIDEKNKHDERKSRNEHVDYHEHNAHDAEEIIAKELASKKSLFLGYSTDEKVEAHEKTNKKSSFCYVVVVSVVLLIVVSVASFFFFSFIQSPKEDFNKLTYRHYLEKIEDEKSRIDIAVDSIVSLEVARIDSKYRKKKKKASRMDSLFTKNVGRTTSIRQYIDSIGKSNSENVDSFVIPIRYDLRIVGLLQKHKVKRGETLKSISLLYYGEKKYSDFIFVYNSKHLFNPDILKYGVVIDIPQIRGVDIKNKQEAKR